MLLNKLEIQQYQCVYSGRKLILGQNASLDHIIAKSRGGSESLDNLQWVDRNVNYMKRALSHDDFLDLVRQIASTCHE